MTYVPVPPPDWRERTSDLASLLRGKRLAVLTGAGVSTESGIPDYRGEETARRARNPIRFAEFVADEAGRRRYWARSTLGWPRFKSARPNSAHESLRRLEERGVVVGLITQNVDRLHQRAGSERVVELHGALADVICLDCGRLEDRDDLQSRILAANPGWLAHEGETAPDGDVELSPEEVERFRVVGCEACGGRLKPKVVFFGEGVPAPTVAEAFALQDDADALLVVGSSLAVFSGYRFPRRAALEGKPVFVINVGVTRADPLASRTVPGVAGEALRLLAEELS